MRKAVAGAARLAPDRASLFVDPAAAVVARVSYVPFVWHPHRARHQSRRRRLDFTPDMLVERASVRGRERRDARGAASRARGVRANPVFLPAPHEVVRALVYGVPHAAAAPSEPWLHQSLWHSIQVIFWGFLLSSIIGVPLGILCGTFRRCLEAAPSRSSSSSATCRRRRSARWRGGARYLRRAQDRDHLHRHVLSAGAGRGQHHAQARSPALLEAAQTLGASKRQLVFKVVVPGVVVDLYTDMRVLLGWAWTYLIVAELIGITQRHHVLHQSAGALPQLRRTCTPRSS